MNIQKYRILILILLFLSFSVYLTNISVVSGDIELYSTKNNSLKMSTSGSADWYRTWGGSGYDTCSDMILDESGNIYLAGFTDSYGNGSYDMLLLKFNSAGELLFNRTWGCTGNEDCYGIELDDSGCVYLAGSTDSFGAGGKDMCLLKFDVSGTFQWNITWGGNGDELCYDIEIDDSGYIYLAGSTSSFGAGNYDMCLVKFYDTGDYIWNKTWGGSNSERCNDFEINVYDEFFLGGFTRSFGDSIYGDIALVKYSWSEEYDWERIWAGNYSDNCASLITDPLGNVYLGGNTYSYGQGENDALIVKYDRSGNQKWNLTWGTKDFERCSDIILDSSENIYITGTSGNELGFSEMLVLKIDNLGNPSWYCTWGLDYEDFGYAIAIDSINNIYITGVTENSTGNSDICLVKNPKSVVTDDIAGYEVYLFCILIIMTIIGVIFKRDFSKGRINSVK